MRSVTTMTLCLLLAGSAWAKDELTKSTWEIPAPDEIHSQLEVWLAEADIDAELAERIRKLWQQPIAANDRLSRLAECFALANTDAKLLVDFCQSVWIAPTLPEFEFLSSSQLAPFERDNLRLFYGRWLAQNQLYNEALAQLTDLQAQNVVDPAALLFYQSVAHHRLLQKEDCIPVVERLLEKEAVIPKRFSTVAKLIKADIEPLKPDSLDEISRLMDSVQVRLGHGRAGTRVRSEEDDVIAKLDKMIKELEAQAQQAQASASGNRAGDALNPAQPMGDSMPGGASGPGNVDAKQLEKTKGWGNLPAKERQQALQQLGKDFPSHYRDVIVEYFRKIAREGAEP